MRSERYDVDAMRLDTSKPHADTTLSISQCWKPDAKHGHNPNHVMIRRFLRSAVSYLTTDGKVLITAVDSPHYQGAFQFDEAAKFAGYEEPETYPFDPSMFPGYSYQHKR